MRRVFIYNRPFIKYIAMITEKCNLHCKHCDVYHNNKEEVFDADKYLHALRDPQVESIQFFGGEPLLYPDRLKLCLDDEVIRSKKLSISTNLTMLDDYRLDLIKIACGENGMSTSWDPYRFTDAQYATWLKNIDRLAAEKIKTAVTTVLSEDLISMPPTKIINIIKDWNHDAICRIKFLWLIADEITDGYRDRAEDWVIELYKNWNLPIKLIDEEGILYADKYPYMYADCEYYRTLFPDGTISSRCMHGKGIKPKFIEECLTCKYSDNCRPCMYVPYCPRFKKLNEYIKSNMAQPADS